MRCTIMYSAGAIAIFDDSSARWAPVGIRQTATLSSATARTACTTALWAKLLMTVMQNVPHRHRLSGRTQTHGHALRSGPRRWRAAMLRSYGGDRAFRHTLVGTAYRTGASVSDVRVSTQATCAWLGAMLIDA